MDRRAVRLVSGTIEDFDLDDLSYSWFWVNARCLGEHDSLRELDAAYPYCQRGGIPYLKYSRLDSCHALPGGRIIRIVDSSKTWDISTLLWFIITQRVTPFERKFWHDGKG